MSKQLTNFYYKSNRLNQLKGFYYTVIHNGSVTDAAKAMHVSAATVTLQIQSLERDLETQLFSRGKKPLRLTVDGERFYRSIAAALQEVDGAVDEFLLQKKEPPKTVNIAAHHIAISYLLPRFIKQFNDSFSDINLNICNISRDEAAKRLKLEEIDMMLYPTTEVPVEFMFKPSFSYEPVLLMRRDHPLALKQEIELSDVSNYPLVRIDKGLITLPLFETVVDTYGWGSNITFEQGNWEILKHFVRADIGLALVNTLCIDKEDPLLMGKSMVKYFPKMTYGIMIKHGRHVHESLRNFIDIVDPEFFQ